MGLGNPDADGKRLMCRIETVPAGAVRRGSIRITLKGLSLAHGKTNII